MNRFTTEVVNGRVQLTGLNSVVNDSKNNWSWKVLRVSSSVLDQTIQTVPALDKGIGDNIQNEEKIIFRFGRP